MTTYPIHAFTEPFPSEIALKLPFSETSGDNAKSEKSIAVKTAANFFSAVCAWSYNFILHRRLTNRNIYHIL